MITHQATVHGVGGLDSEGGAVARDGKGIFREGRGR